MLPGKHVTLMVIACCRNSFYVKGHHPTEVTAFAFKSVWLVRYPLLLNHPQICWPEGVCDGGLMEDMTVQCYRTLVAVLQLRLQVGSTGCHH